jgi:hypothetical protein
LPSSRIPSPFVTVAPPASSIRSVRPAGVTRKRKPVFDWTITSVLPDGVASIPFALKAPGVNWMSPVSWTGVEAAGRLPPGPSASLYRNALNESVKNTAFGVTTTSLMNDGIVGVSV